MSDLDGWVAAVCAELGIDGPIDRDRILDLARDVAHGVARPAAPLTTHLVGLAAGRAAAHGTDSTKAAEDAIARVSALAAAWPVTQAEPG